MLEVILPKEPLSSQEVVDCVRMALAKVYNYDVKSISIALHYHKGVYETIEYWPELET